ncbi:MAG: OmpH family outer membrane protein [Balneolaceae bacterium]
MKKVLFTALILLFPFAVFGQLKVGIMDPQIVLEAMPETEGVQAELDDYIQGRQNVFQNSYANWIEEITRYTEDVEAGNLTRQEREREEERLGQMEEELEALQRRIQNQIQQKQNELLNPLLIRIENTMEAIARQLDLDYVINKTASTGDPIVYYSSSRGVDITNRVIEEIKNN